MAVAFSRTIRALRTENAFVYVILLGVAMVLLLFWGHWFFTASITSKVYSQDIRLHPEILTVRRELGNGMVVRSYPFRQRQLYANFAQASFAKLKRGQLAWARVRSPQGQAVHALPGEVVDLMPDRFEDGGTAMIRIEVDAKQPDYLADFQNLRVIVATEPTTPAQLVLNATGIGVDTPAVSVRKE
jgi:hypothetical protein